METVKPRCVRQVGCCYPCEVWGTLSILKRVLAEFARRNVLLRAAERTVPAQV